MIKAILWAIKTKLNQIEKEYGDYKLQEAKRKEMQNLPRDYFYFLNEAIDHYFFNAPSMFTKTPEGETQRKVSKEVREKGKIKEVSKK